MNMPYADLLARYGRAIVFMRQQIAAGRFGIVVGPGATASLGYPHWNELASRLVTHPDVSKKLRSTSISSLTPGALVAAFHASAHAAAPQTGTTRVPAAKYRSLAEWQRIVHDCLYRDVSESAPDFIARAGYLSAYLPLFRKLPLTINLGFGDAIQRLLLATLAPADRAQTRGSTTVFEPDVRVDARTCVIYHPNGYVPVDLRDRGSERLRFPADSPLDLMSSGFAGHMASLAFHLLRNSWLFLGARLADDVPLMNLLEQEATIYAGHHHCLVVDESDAEIHEAALELTRRANFHRYNLITMALAREEVSAVGELLAMEGSTFHQLTIDTQQRKVFRYYVTGSVSVGKSTTVSQLRSLLTMDEWLDRRAPGMEKAFTQLGTEELQSIDHWVASQWRLKNRLVNAVEQGIVVVDRSPLDAFAFTPTSEWREKAELTHRLVTTGADAMKLVPAHIILLVGEPEVMAARSLARHKDMNVGDLDEQQSLLQRIFVGKHGVSVVHTVAKSVQEVVKDVAWIIHMEEPYSEMNLEGELEQFLHRGYEAADA